MTELEKEMLDALKEAEAGLKVAVKLILTHVPHLDWCRSAPRLAHLVVTETIAKVEAAAAVESDQQALVRCLKGVLCLHGVCDEPETCQCALCDARRLLAKIERRAA